MVWRRIGGWFLVCAIALASEQHGQVTFNGLPVPGATVTATRENTRVATTTDPAGRYSFADLADGVWKIEVKMLGFATLTREVSVSPGSAADRWELTLLSLAQIHARPQAAAAVESPPRAETRAAAPAPRPVDEDLAERAADGFLINGSTNNGAASPFAQMPAFGNRRAGQSLYTGGIGLILDNSALDARPFSLSGENTPKPVYNRMTGLLALGGPLRIPHLLRNGPNFFVGYQWTRNNNDTVATGLVPDIAERNGFFSTPVIDPLTGAPFAGNVIPENRVSPQARALLGFYPLPNDPSNPRYNYQIPLVSPTHHDALESRMNEMINGRNQVYGQFAFQDTRSDNPNLFGFLDTTDVLGINTDANWWHRLSENWFLTAGERFSRLSTRVKTNFEDRQNVSGEAGITGNDQNPMEWGPPSLTFASGIAGMADGNAAFNRNQSTAESISLLWNHRAHDVTYGADFVRREFNYLSQQDPRGTFTFTGAATGNDFADFLLGAPDTSQIAFGNADKYFRESVYDAYLNDDWRVSTGFTLNAGVRWEYGAPITELYGRLVNLDLAPEFTAAAPVVAGDPVGPVTGEHYPSSLVRPYKGGFEPRIGIAWRPIGGSSLVVRAGYGVYYDTSVYQTIALEMAQQPPLSKTLSVQNSAASPLTLADGFSTAGATTGNTFAIDPNFRPGYAQNWQVSVQRDLPGSLQMTATYLGIKGTHGVQDLLPNTYPIGAVSPCPTCPVGFAWLTSNGNSTREAGELQMRRRLHNGLAAILQYTYSKAIDDDAALGGQGAYIAQSITAQNASGPGMVVQSGTGGGSGGNPAIAQNWLDLRAERGRSTFDQRHVLGLGMQYTTGVGTAGGTLLSGWRGALLKGWTAATQISAATGLPETPVYLAAVPGTGVTGTIRPEFTGAPLYSAPPGFFLNPASFVAPPAGQWGNAGRDSVTGPAQFTLNASLGRTFRLSDRLHLDLRLDSTNALNRVNFTAWDTTINSAQFGLPAAANAMRSVQTTLRLRF